MIFSFNSMIWCCATKTPKGGAPEWESFTESCDESPPFVDIKRYDGVALKAARHIPVRPLIGLWKKKTAVAKRRTSKRERIAREIVALEAAMANRVLLV